MSKTLVSLLAGVFLFLSCSLLAYGECARLALSDRALEPGRVTVKRVVDGDTLLLDDRRRVRLIGINAPERSRRNTPAEPFAAQAKRYLEQLIARDEGRIWAVNGRDPLDRYGRNLMHLYLADGSSVSGLLLGEGLAIRIAFPPNLGHQECFALMESNARQLGKGLWSAGYWRPVQGRTPERPGFQLTTGRVKSITESRTAFWIDLDNRVVLKISREISSRGKLNGWIGKTVEARGWMIDRRESENAREKGYQPWLLVIRDLANLSIKDH